MMSQEVTANARSKWNEASDALQNYSACLHRILQEHRSEIVALIENAFRTHHAVPVAVDLFPLLTETEMKALLPLMLSYCSSGRYAHIAKPFIASLPRDWTLEVIETYAEATLAENDFLDWCNLLDLYQQLDSDLALRFVGRMAQHANPDIRECGEDFLKDQVHH
jgi:hypothetical protein